MFSFLHGDNLVVETEPEASRKKKENMKKTNTKTTRRGDRKEGRGVTAENEKKVAGKSEEGK